MKDDVRNIPGTKIEGNFKINKKYCFLCHKLIDIYMVLTFDKLIFYKDKDKKQLYQEIERNLILAINRRLRREKDKNNLSIYYMEDNNSNIIKELKLKCFNRFEMEKWIALLNKKINPKRIEFNDVSNKNYVNSNDIFHFENKSDLYVSLCNLEYILSKNKMKSFFEIYRNKYGKNDPVNSESIDESNLILDT